MDAGDLVPTTIIIGLATERHGIRHREGLHPRRLPRTSAQAVALDMSCQSWDARWTRRCSFDGQVIVKHLTSRRMCRDAATTSAPPPTRPTPSAVARCTNATTTTAGPRCATASTCTKSTAPLIDPYYRGCGLLVSIDGDRDQAWCTPT